jgi:two-component system, LytTR family, response regulator
MERSEKYATIIVEDEPHQQARLLELIHYSHSDLEIECICDNIESAYTMIRQIRPQLVFLDVMLPPTTSFDLLARFPSLDFEIIFTTSFEEFAVKAFRLSAVDYLMKPLIKEELDQAIARFRERVHKREPHDEIKVLLENLQAQQTQKKKIALPTLTGFIFITIEDIIRCESDNTYTTFHLNDKRKIVVSRTLKECETMLSDFSFFRVHNSNLINLEYIVEYTKGEGGIVKMKDGSSVDVSRRRKDEFVRLFNKIGETRQ